MIYDISKTLMAKVSVSPARGWLRLTVTMSSLVFIIFADAILFSDKTIIIDKIQKYRFITEKRYIFHYIKRKIYIL